MGLEYAEADADKFNYATDWRESNEDHQPGGGHFSLDAQDFSCTGIIPWNKLRSAIRFFLGYAYNDQGAPFLLHRENPSPHPLFPWLYCYDVHFAGLGPKSNAANVGTPVGNTQPFPYLKSPFFTTPDALRASNYDRASLTLSYRSVKYRYLKDSAILTPDDEWMRSCFIECENRLDFLTADGVGQLTFAEGQPATGAGQGPTAGKTPFPAPVATPLAKGDYVINWYGLPFDYLSQDPDVFDPVKILKCFGKVNSKDFVIGDNYPLFPAGTVLMKGLKYTTFPWPVAAADFTRPLLGVHVAISVEFFNPAKGVPASTYVGHNLMPWRGGDVASGDLLGGKFFLATRGGATTNPGLLETYNFENIWYHWQAPTIP